jgi:UDP-2-acetamido-2,6-beta-L-arabino-hexul-4-ose reductase
LKDEKEEVLMDILVTGAQGFIGRNLVADLNQRGYSQILKYDQDSPPELLDDFAARCGFVFHCAGVNRPTDPADFMRVNAGLTQNLVDALARHGNKAPILFISSTQATLDNLYGQSKKAAEQAVFNHAAMTASPAFVYRLTNVFGKWSRPNYNSVVATFCHNIARGLPISINNRETAMNLLYIDDVLKEFTRVLNNHAEIVSGYGDVQPIHPVKLGRIADLIESFRLSRENLHVPDLSCAFTKKLYSTYLSYLPADDFGYPLKMNIDNRGSFTEFLRTPERGQISVNIAKPGITKGNHWHHTKTEKFLVVSGEGIIRFRAPGSEEVIEYRVSGNELCPIDIPPGYTHNIENIGTNDMVTLMWVNECFDPENPDTYALEV